MSHPDYPYSIAVPGRILKEMGENLLISESLLYRLFRKSKMPSPISQKRLCRALDLPAEIWSKEPHEAARAVYDAYRDTYTAESIL